MGILGMILWISSPTYASIDIPWGDMIRDVSISGPIESAVDIDSARNFWLQILGMARIVISGIALIFMVVVGARIIIFSDSEEETKKFKSQLLYTMLGFLFLNVPTVIYDVFGPSVERGDFAQWGTWWDIEGGSAFWNVTGFNGFFSGLLDFLKVFIFWLAVVFFTWWAFELVISRWRDDKREVAQNRLVYGVLALVFLWFVEGWTRWIAAPDGNFMRNVQDVAWSAFSIAFFFAAPVAIFFLILWAYYYFTSWGEEERAKKGKSIIINTIIATIILIASLSFIQELVGFSK